jgi:hypothetical protein
VRGGWWMVWGGGALSLYVCVEKGCCDGRVDGVRGIERVGGDCTKGFIDVVSEKGK